MDAAEGVSVSEGSAGFRRERRLGAAARLVEEASSSARGHYDRRQGTEEVRCQRDAGFPRATGPWRSGTDGSRMARAARRRRRPGAAEGPMGRGGWAAALRGARALEKTRTGASGRPVIHRGHASSGRSSGGPDWRRRRRRNAAGMVVHPCRRVAGARA